MAKEMPEEKKPGIIKRFLRCIVLAVLLFLIAMALIFQAPWKVTILLLIILLAYTVLPKPAKKWFWLSVGTAVIALIVWVFLPDRGQWTPYKHNFEKELKALNDKYAIPDEENAAIIYNELLENYESGDFISNLNTYDLAWLEPWLSEDYPTLAQWLAGHEKTIVTLLKASKIEKCQFRIDEDSLRSILGPSGRPHLGAMKELALLLVCAANNDLAEKRTEQGLEKQITLLRMSEHLRQQPITVDMLTGIAFQKFALSQINALLVTANPKEPYLTKLEDVITGIELDWKADWTRIAESEKLGVMKSLFWTLYETNTQGKIRITVAEYFWHFQAISQQEAPYWITRLAKIESILSWLFLPHTPKEAARIIDKTLQKYGSMGNLDSRWKQRSRASSLTSLGFNFSYIIRLHVDRYVRSLHDFFMHLKSDKRATRVIIALRQYKNNHGCWPEKLDDIRALAPAETFVDSLNGGSFVYKLTEENFTLYSKGKNNIDEGGRRDTRRRRKTGADDILIWPPRRR